VTRWACSSVFSEIQTDVQESNYLTSIIDFNRFKGSFSNNSDKHGRSDIDLYEVTCFGDFPGLSSMIT